MTALAESVAPSFACPGQECDAHASHLEISFAGNVETVKEIYEVRTCQAGRTHSRNKLNMKVEGSQKEERMVAA